MSETTIHALALAASTAIVVVAYDAQYIRAMAMFIGALSAIGLGECMWNKVKSWR